MGTWNSKKIVELAERDFERAWLETAKLIPKKVPKKYPVSKKSGKAHVIFETLQRLRTAYMSMGFEEVVNPVFIEDKEVRRQFGPEGYAVLDRCYYLGGLPRPDVGLSPEKTREIKRLGAKVNKKELQEILHRYKKGEFGGDDIIYKLAESMSVNDVIAAKILNEVFSEFRALKPSSGRTTLRSHMTGGWFITLQELINRKPPPVKLFSVDRCFRREQKEDETHLRTHHSASCVVAGEDTSIEDGKAVAEALLGQFGFKKFKFKPDEKRSKYYAPGTQTEVYGYSPETGWVELATFGIYSPVSLSKYEIEVPVMNLGLGVERLAMVLHGFRDLREMVYPQFYAKWKLDDRQIATMISIDRIPVSSEGKKIVGRIVNAARKYSSEKSPCEFLAYKGNFLGKNIEVKLVEREEDTKLLGPAALNEVYVHEGNVYGILGVDDITKKGVSCSFGYIDGISNLAAYEIEEGVKSGKSRIITRIPKVRSLGDVNLRIEDVGLRYITANSKSIDIRGPVFITIETNVKLK
ncbi:MAG: O-phosphoserine--tRNA ligase [Candidatus Hydrothermarchaeaceae archaeon]